MKPLHKNHESSKPLADLETRRRVRVEVPNRDLGREDLNPETPATIRERRRRTAGKGVRIAALLFFFMGIISAGHLVIQKAFSQNERFLLNHISVQTSGFVSEAKIREVMALDYGMNLLKVSLVEIRERIEKLPQVKKASVAREYPGGLRVQVEQRHPIAWIERLGSGGRGGDSAWIDEDGVVLPSVEGTPLSKELPVFQVFSLKDFVFGEKFESALLNESLTWYRHYLNSELKEVCPIHSVLAMKPYSLSVRFTGDFTVNFPTEDYVYHLSRLKNLLEHATEHKLEIETVDLLVQEFVPVTLKTRVEPLDGKKLSHHSPLNF